MLAGHGQSLFEQIFAANSGVSAEYIDAKRHGFDDTRLIITGSAAFHRLHWDALRDPALPEEHRLPIYTFLGRS